MKLVNLRNKKVLVGELKIAESFIDRSLGLLRKTNPRSLLFKTRYGIHTFGLLQPIDVLVLDNKNRVVKLCKNLQPNRLFFWNPLYNTVIELPEGTILKSKTMIEDILKLVY